MIYTGTFQRSLDGKARFLLPKRMRADLAESATLFLTPGTDHCLELHTHESLHEMARRANQSAAGSENVKSFSRLFYAQAEQCEIDGQGRIRVPSQLAEYADLAKEIVIVGVGFSWEIWNPRSWQAYLLAHQNEFDRLSQTTFDNTNGFVEIHQPTTSTNQPPSRINRTNPR